MKFLAILVIALVAVLVVSGCSSKPAYNILSDIQVTVPEGWITEPPSATSVVYSSPLEDDSDLYYENLAVDVEILYEPTTLEAYLTASIQNLKEVLGKDPGPPQSTTFAGLPAYKLEYDYTIADSGLEADLRVVQLITIKNNKAYVITYGGEKAKFSQYETTFQQMVDSFKIKS